MAKILILAGDFVEDYELMVPYQALLMLGHNVDVVCPKKQAGDIIKTAIHDFEGDQTYTEKRGHNFVLNKNFSDFVASDYDALVIPGGRAPEYIRLDDKVIHTVKHFVEHNLPIASICHGPQVLLTANAIKGRKCTAYISLKPDIISAGGEWIEPNETATNAVTDENLVTAPAWPAHPEWLKQFIQLLK